MRTSLVGALVLALLLAPRSLCAQDTDPQFRADTESLLQLNGSADVGAVAKVVAVQLVEAMKRTRPDLPDRTLGIVTEVITAEFSKAFVAPGGVRDRMVTVYMTQFTHDEVRALLSFYRTPLGRKTVSLLPTLTQEGQSAALGWVNANMKNILGTLQQRLRAEGLMK